MRASSAEKSSWASVENLALECMLEAGDRVLAGLVVGRQRDHALGTLLLQERADRLVDLVVLECDCEEVRIALRTGERRRAGIRTDQEHLGARGRLHDRHQDVRERGADDDRRLLLLDQAFGLLDADLGLELIVNDHQLDRNATELAVELLQRQLEPVHAVDAELRLLTRQGCDIADLDRLRGRHARRERGCAKPSEANP
jgi:hypothetical protein